jgi:catechol-2,3-dioxygenase
MSDAIRFAGVALECPDAAALAAFYAAITGGTVTFADSQWVTLTVSDGRMIDFQTSPGHVAPTWPDPAASMQMHLDFVVDDLDATEARVLAAGATKFGFQPNWHCRVFADPAGHPFCLSMQATAGELEL